MTETYIKTFEGKILAIIQTDTNGDQTLRDFPSRTILGYYRAKRDVTTNFLGKELSKGNILSSLVKQKE